MEKISKPTTFNTSHKQRLFSKKMFGIGLIALTIILSGAFLILKLQAKSPIPKPILQEAAFDVYYPSNLPKTFKVDQASYTFKDGVLAFAITNNSETKLFVSEQQKPTAFDFNNFNEQNIDTAHQILTPAGTATIGLVSNNLHLISIVGDKTWILCNTSSTTSSDDTLDAIAKSFILVKH